LNLGSLKTLNHEAMNFVTSQRKLAFSGHYIQAGEEISDEKTRGDMTSDEKTIFLPWITAVLLRPYFMTVAYGPKIEVFAVDVLAREAG
jgi:hypothetical protein